MYAYFSTATWLLFYSSFQLWFCNDDWSAICSQTSTIRSRCRDAVQLNVQFSIADECFRFVTGFGKSKRAKLGSKRDFVEQFMKAVKLDRPVLICASMSGRFALPFVFRPEAATCTDRLRGFVPIAPAAASQFSKDDYGSCKVNVAIQVAFFSFTYWLELGALECVQKVVRLKIESASGKAPRSRCQSFGNNKGVSPLLFSWLGCLGSVESSPSRIWARTQEGRVRGSQKFGADVRNCIWRLCRYRCQSNGNDHLSKFNTW